MNDSMKKPNLPIRLVAGIAAGIGLGSLGYLFSDNLIFVFFMRAVVTFSDLFSKFLSFVIPILILSFVSKGLADLGKSANKLFGITIFTAYASTVTAGILAYFAGVNLLPLFSSDTSGGISDFGSYNVLFDLELTPVFGVMTALVLAFILGLGMANIKSGALSSVVGDVKEIIEKLLGKIIIPLIPVYVACVFCNIAATGKLVVIIKMFAAAFLITVILQWIFIFIQFSAASLITGKNQLGRIKNCMPAYITALGTQSSAITIPVNVKCGYDNGIKKEVADFTLPLCATIHLAGDTIALTIGTMAVAAATGAGIASFGAYIPFILMLGVIMVAAPGVPGGGVMAALGIVESMLGFGAGMQSLLIGFHFAQDSFGTAANVTGDQAIALIVNGYDDKSEVTSD